MRQPIGRVGRIVAIALFLAVIGSIGVGNWLTSAASSANAPENEPYALIDVNPDRPSSFHAGARISEQATRERVIKTLLLRLNSTKIQQSVLKDPSVKNLNLGTEEEAARKLREGILATVEPGTDVIRIRFKGLPRERAVLIINKVVDAFMLTLKQDETAKRLERLLLRQAQWRSKSEELETERAALGAMQGQIEIPVEAAGAILDQQISADTLMNDRLTTERVAISTQLDRLKARKIQPAAVLEKIEDLSDQRAILDAKSTHLSNRLIASQHALKKLRVGRPDYSSKQDQIRVLENTVFRLGNELADLKFDLNAPEQVMLIEKAE